MILLALALIATSTVLALALIRLDEAQQQIEHQRELIEEKDTFASAAEQLMSAAAQFDGLPYASIVRTSYYKGLITAAWNHRWNSVALARDTEKALDVTADLVAVHDAAAEQAATNSSGTYFEAITDQLGSGYVSTSLDTADAACLKDVWGCVTSDEPFTIHYDASQMNAEVYMSDWLREGTAYHEFAHVLQDTNPGPTSDTVKAFGGDYETMADCYSLTMLPGWTLDHTIWVSDYQYWEVSVGYGYTCNETQRQAIRDWVEAIGYTHEPISQ